MAAEFEIDLKDGLSEPASQMREALGSLSESMLGALGSTGELLGPIGLAAGAMLAGVAAAGALTLAGAQLALSASEAKEALLSQFAALAGGPKAAEGMLDTIRQLEKVLPQNEATLGAWANKLLAAGIAPDKIAQSLTAVASAGALVQGGSEKLLSILTRLTEQGMKGTKIRFNASMLAGTGISEKELMDALGMTPAQLELAKKQGLLTGQQLADGITKVLAAKGKGPLEQQMSTLGTIFTKLKNDVTTLFADVDIKPFISALKDLGSVFGADTASGKTMKMIVTNAFNAIFAAASKVIPYIKIGFLFLVVQALRVYIAIKPIGPAFQALWAKVQSGNNAGGVMKRFAASIFPIAKVAQAAARGVLMLISVVGKLVALDTAGKDAAAGLIHGLVSGISNGVGMVMDAIRGLGSSAISALKSVLHISSPSKVMMKMGSFTGQGMAQGIDAARPQVSSSAGKLAAAAVPSSSGQSRSGSGSSSGGGGIQIDVGGIQISGAGSGAEALTLTEAAVAAIFERLAIEQGLGTT